MAWTHLMPAFAMGRYFVIRGKSVYLPGGNYSSACFPRSPAEGLIGAMVSRVDGSKATPRSWPTGGGVPALRNLGNLRNPESLRNHGTGSSEIPKAETSKIPTRKARGQRRFPRLGQLSAGKNDYHTTGNTGNSPSGSAMRYLPSGRCVHAAAAKLGRWPKARGVMLSCHVR